MVDIFLGMDEAESVMKDMFVALKIGDTQKFSKASVGKRYKFSEKTVGDRRFGKLEVYKRVGVHSIAIAPELVKDAAEFSVSVSDLSSDQLKFYMEVNPEEGVEKKRPPPEGYKNTAARSEEIKEYLEKHQLEMRLSEAMQSALREQPADPAAFIADKLTSRVGMITPVPSRPVTAAQDLANEQGGLGATEPVGTVARREDIRARATQAISGACHDGRLEAALNHARAGRQPIGSETTKTVGTLAPGGDPGLPQQDIRARAAQAISGAFHDGRLETALKHNRAGSQPNATAEKAGDVVDVNDGTAGNTDATQIGADSPKAASLNRTDTTALAAESAAAAVAVDAPASEASTIPR
eukprot:TRINITY_DN4134_c0_g1_i1.p1 TRINITY_DN4134_c0_g1~~TRINITY_DN4134_c0_g1_i1.p1  ORF type:complete len:354 (+),score=70.56 TRINITY_DN4134_c0_g1_i1:102-1163(+)